jgi:Ner family transcriptional regulator
MTTPKNQEKPAADWHPADIVAAIRKKGWSMNQLGLHHGYGTNALCLAFRKPYPKAERIIAETLGLRPEQIWPSRYDANGMPNRRRGRPIRPENVLPRVSNGTPVREGGDMPDRKAA